MYNVKESGRGSYRYFSAEMNTRMQERLQLEIGLRKAIAERQFELAYQPKVNIGSGEVVGLEALLRWRHPERGVVAPGQFIAVAEDTGLIVEIGRWVLEEVCRQLREWRDRGVSPLPVAVNLSVRQFTPALVGEISTAMVAHGVAPGQIEVEITESLFMHNAEEVRGILKGLSRLGARVTIDDFGTGYSSLGYIRHFSVNALKIDRAFLSDISSSSQNLAIVRAVITMCRGLGIGVIAEGVEHKEQLEILRKLHCDEYQGYLFSRPVSAEEVSRRYLGVIPQRKVLSGQQ
jgi:EAL domain-containing protein (putative c-di-GMP-specific phosphodiesterase class I)